MGVCKRCRRIKINKIRHTHLSYSRCNAWINYSECGIALKPRQRVPQFTEALHDKIPPDSRHADRFAANQHEDRKGVAYREGLCVAMVSCLQNEMREKLGRANSSTMERDFLKRNIKMQCLKFQFFLKSQATCQNPIINLPLSN